MTVIVEARGGARGRRGALLAAALLIGLPGVASPRARTDEGKAASESRGSAEFPALPGSIAGLDDASARATEIAARVEDLIGRAKSAEKAGEKAGLLLSAASVILGEQLEPSCTRAMLGMPANGTDGLSAAEASAPDRADGLIAEAVTIAGAGDGAESGDEAASVARRAETLRAFSRGMRAYLDDSGEGSAASERRRAASALAPLLEDSDRRIASAARLWQAALRSREEDPSAALYILESALADPPPDSLPYALYARLMRCRLMGSRGGSASALALLTLMEERINGWFSDGAERDRAVRTVALVKVGVLRDWHDRLSPVDRAEERAWCVGQAARIAERFFSREGSLYRLMPAVPIIGASESPKATRSDEIAHPSAEHEQPIDREREPEHNQKPQQDPEPEPE